MLHRVLQYMYVRMTLSSSSSVQDLRCICIRNVNSTGCIYIPVGTVITFKSDVLEGIVNLRNIFDFFAYDKNPV